MEPVSLAHAGCGAGQRQRSPRELQRQELGLKTEEWFASCARQLSPLCKTRSCPVTVVALTGPLVFHPLLRGGVGELKVCQVLRCTVEVVLGYTVESPLLDQKKAHIKCDGILYPSSVLP